MDQQLLQKISEQLGGILEWQKQHERHDDERFASMATAMHGLPNKDDLSKLANKEDVARLNNYVQTFTTGIEVFSTTSKWAYRAVLAIAAFVIAWGIITGAAKGIIAGMAAWAIGARK